MIQLLVGMALGLGILSAASVWVSLQWQADQRQLKRSQNQQDIRALIDTLVSDLQRANFKGRTTGKSAYPNPTCPSDFCNADDDFKLTEHQILFSLDRNDNGIKDNNECSGFRLNGKQLQTKTSCAPVVWTSLNALKNIEVIQLTFQLLCTSAQRSSSSVIRISLSTQSTSEPTPLVWQRHVQLRNQHWPVTSPQCDTLA
jgi:Tfp pilus assembly protein PilW